MALCHGRISRTASRVKADVRRPPVSGSARRDPHWQVVDSRGSVYPLDRLKLHEDKINTSITVPSYIPDIAKVQIWCAWAEVLLGETSFSKPVVAYGKR